jgi:hypothetical protein
MTAICGGSSSSPKLGTAIVADYSAARVAQLMIQYGMSEVNPILPLVGLVPLVLNDFCGTDPPAMVALTSAEASALLNVTFDGNFFSGLGKVKNIVLNTIWYDACQCSAGAPTPLAPPALPADTPHTVYPSGSTNQPCLGVGGLDDHFITQPNTAPVTATYKFSIFDPTTGNTTTYQYTRTNTQPMLTVTIPTPPGSTISNASINWSPTVGFTVGLANPPVGATSLVINMQVVNQPATSSYSAEYGWAYYCNGDVPGATQTPCCPPDAATTALLTHIMEYVTLIQRQLAPFGYIPGPAHAGLSGTGEITITEPLLGVRLQVTALPTRAGRTTGDPTRYWDIGELALGDADGWFYRRRIDTSALVWTPKDAQLATRIGYTIPADTIVSVTELRKEP